MFLPLVSLFASHEALICIKDSFRGSTAKLGPSWGQVGAKLGPSWGQDGAKLGAKRHLNAAGNPERAKKWGGP